MSARKLALAVAAALTVVACLVASASGGKVARTNVTVGVQGLEAVAGLRATSARGLAGHFAPPLVNDHANRVAQITPRGAGPFPPNPDRVGRHTKDTIREDALRLGGALAVVAIGLLATAAPPASAEAVLDADCPGPETITFPSGVDARWAETFTALNTGSLVRGETEIGKSGTAGDFVMQILAIDGLGNPMNDVLASTTIPDASVPIGNSRIVGVFATPANVVAGQRYAFMITRPGAEFTVRDAGNDPCPDGAEHLSTSQTAAWSGADTCCDLLFAVFVEPLAGPGPPSNQFTLGKLKRNLTKGTATLTIEAPNPGELTGSGKGVKVAAAAVISKTVSAPGAVKLTIRAKGKKKTTLDRTGEVTVRPKITYTPTGGAPNTQSIKVKLKKR